jgi:hypothetical protein
VRLEEGFEMKGRLFVVAAIVAAVVAAVEPAAAAASVITCRSATRWRRATSRSAGPGRRRPVNEAP